MLKSRLAGSALVFAFKGYDGSSDWRVQDGRGESYNPSGRPRRCDPQGTGGPGFADGTPMSETAS